MQRRRMMRHLSTQTFIQNMRRMQTEGNFYDDDAKEEKLEDFSLIVYRQHAPRFKDRVKDMEQKILHPVSANRTPSVCVCASLMIPNAPFDLK
jgi:hypothetical protein